MRRVVEGRTLGITEGPYEIAHDRMKTLYWGDTYVIDYVNPVDELLVLICMLCIDASDAPSRSDELKKTLRHKLLY